MVVFRPAVRRNVGVIIGVAGASGSGKTFSAFRLAKGIAGGRRFAVLDTEAGRALHYADMFEFDHAELSPPFRPQAYLEGIREADNVGYPVIVVDSMSHEWDGEGGLLDWQEQELQRMAGDDYGKREACKMASWIKPKMAHKPFVQRLLQVRATLILCFRAEEKTLVLDTSKPGDKNRVERMVSAGQLSEKDAKRKTVIAPAGWQPICEKKLPYELTVSFLLEPPPFGDPGVPKPLKLQEQHKAFFPVGAQLNEAAGQRMAEWARGGAVLDTTEYKAEGLAAAKRGLSSLGEWWQGLPRHAKRELEAFKDTELKPLAQDLDREQPGETASSDEYEYSTYNNDIPY